MLSQLNLRFPKSLIAALKNRAAAEAVPVNTLAERLLQQTLATSVAGDEYRALCAAPYTTLGQLYRKVVRAETVDGQALSRAELRWLFSQAQIAYRDGRGPVNRAPLSALLLITDALLETAVGGGLDVDPHYYRRTFGLRGEDWLQALRDRFTATCTPPAGSAEFFARSPGTMKPQSSGEWTRFAQFRTDVLSQVMGCINQQARIKLVDTFKIERKQ